MKHNAFRTIYLACSIVLVCMGGTSLAVNTITYVNPKSCTYTYSVTILNQTATVSNLQLWMPLPKAWPSQQNIVLYSASPTGYSVNDGPDGKARMVHWSESGLPAIGQSIVFSEYFSCTSYEINSSIDTASIPTYDMGSSTYLKYTAAEPFLESDSPSVVSTAVSIVGSETNPYTKARMIYDWVRSNLYFQELPVGDIMGAYWTLNNRYGECGEYVALFVALCRASGIPAKPVVGMLAGTGRNPHVWAEFYLQDIGWVPVDPTFADTGYDPNYYFGNLDNGRLIMSEGYNVNLSPPSVFDPVSLFQVYVWQWYGSGVMSSNYYANAGCCVDQTDSDHDGIGDACDATMVAPISQITATIGSSVAVNWSKGGGVGNVDIELTRNNGTSWGSVAQNRSGTSYKWTVTGPTTTQAKFRIRAAGGGLVYDVSVNRFLIKDAPYQPAIPTYRKISKAAKGRILTGSQAIVISGGSLGGKKFRPGADLLHTFDMVVLFDLGELSVFPGYEDGTIDTMPSQVFLTDSVVTGAAMEDVNSDGLFDLGLSHYDRKRITMHFGQVSGQYTDNAADSVALPGNPTGIELVDCNLDGKRDMIVSLAIPDVMAYLSGNGDGTFGTATTIPVGGPITAFTVADFNRDYVPDVAVAHGDDGQLQLYRGDGEGHFNPGMSVAVGGRVSRLLAYDFDQMNGFDLGVVFDSVQARFVTLMNNGFGLLDAISYETELEGHSDIVAGDLTGDGIVDVAISSALHDSVIVLTGYPTENQSVGFCCPLLVPVGSRPVDLLLQDVDADGRPDLLVLNQGSTDLYVLIGLLSSEVPTNLTVARPNGGEQYQIGVTRTLAWQKGLGVMGVDVQVSRNGGLSWETIATNQSDTVINWLVTPPASTNALIRLFDATVPTRTDVSNASFAITSDCCVGTTGNVNGIGIVDLSDLSALVSYLTGGGYVLPCQSEANVNATGIVDLSDLSALVSYLTGGGYVLPNCP